MTGWQRPLLAAIQAQRRKEALRSQGQSGGSDSVALSTLSINVAKAPPPHYDVTRGQGVTGEVKQSQVDSLLRGFNVGGGAKAGLRSVGRQPPQSG